MVPAPGRLQLVISAKGLFIISLVWPVGHVFMRGFLDRPRRSLWTMLSGSESSIEAFATAISLNFPSRAVRDCMIFSARYGGV